MWISSWPGDDLGAYNMAASIAYNSAQFYSVLIEIWGLHFTRWATYDITFYSMLS